SAIHRLNRAVAVAELHGAAEGLAILNDFDPPAWLADSYLWAAVLADLHRRCGNVDAAEWHGELALKSAPTVAVKELLQRRFDGGDSSSAARE
ncbi:MAG TPA: hypothetical protein VHF69_00300, partial [Candidatus Synoicihabitans sp.]|nr:hypothetical protein [Candidatus Synoicihabitans sp.]